MRDRSHSSGTSMKGGDCTNTDHCFVRRAMHPTTMPFVHVRKHVLPAKDTASMSLLSIVPKCRRALALSNSTAELEESRPSQSALASANTNLTQSPSCLPRASHHLHNPSAHINRDHVHHPQNLSARSGTPPLPTSIQVPITVIRPHHITYHVKRPEGRLPSMPTWSILLRSRRKLSPTRHAVTASSRAQPQQNACRTHHQQQPIRHNLNAAAKQSQP